jgi:filamentous hemagglutinin family protein
MSNKPTLASRMPATRRRTSVLICTSLALVWCACASGAPSGGQVAGGQATIQTQGATTQVQQTTSRAIINWQSFDVAHGETVVFTQPSASAIALNRVTGATASSIAGNINANGRIFIVNPHGVVFGPTASVNTAGLVATTAGIDDNSFMQGRYEFRTPAPDSSQVSNQGVITTTAGGRVALLGVSVENTGTINANGGVVVLGSGQIFLVDLFGDGLVQVASARVQGVPFGPPVTNIGDIRVGAGTVLVRTLLQPFQGSVNGIDVANLASSSVVLPGGTVAFLGSTASNVQSAAPAWLGPAVIALSLQGAGIIDATPTYSFQVAGPSAGGFVGTSVADAAASVPSTVKPALSEFNRLAISDGETNPLRAERDDHTLYTLETRRSAPSYQAQPVLDISPPETAPARRQIQPTAGAKRFCTVNQVMHSSTAQGCR